ncbi:MAG: hypothetical protein ACLQDV_02840 [Candidatus Binataceae bacterium]
MGRFEIDRDVERVLAFMQRHLPARKLVTVAHAVAQLSDLLWTRYDHPVDEAAKLRPFAFVVGDDDFKAVDETYSSGRSLDANGLRPPDQVAANNLTDEMHNVPR